MENEQVENQKYLMSSHWTKNRSKYMVFLTIASGFKDGRYVSTKIFILYNCPVVYQTVESSLPKWIRWKYLTKSTIGTYALTKKGNEFLAYLSTKVSFITQDWLQDLDNWRGINKDSCRTPDGLAWLPEKDLIKQLEILKGHRLGTPRKGSKAGRPSNSLASAPAQGPEAVQLAPAPSMPAPSPKPQQPGTVGIPLPRCPLCNKTLDMGWHHWYCSDCDCSFDSEWQPMKGKR